MKVIRYFGSEKAKENENYSEIFASPVEETIKNVRRRVYFPSYGCEIMSKHEAELHNVMSRENKD